MSNPMTPQDTPLTDCAVMKRHTTVAYATNEHAEPVVRQIVEEVVSADFARSLERKLAAAERDAARLREALQRIVTYYNDYCDSHLRVGELGYQLTEIARAALSAQEGER